MNRFILVLALTIRSTSEKNPYRPHFLASFDYLSCVSKVISHYALCIMRNSIAPHVDSNRVELRRYDELSTLFSSAFKLTRPLPVYDPHLLWVQGRAQTLSGLYDEARKAIGAG